MRTSQPIPSAPFAIGPLFFVGLAGERGVWSILDLDQLRGNKPAALCYIAAQSINALLRFEETALSPGRLNTSGDDLAAMIAYLQHVGDECLATTSEVKNAKLEEVKPDPPAGDN